MLAYFKELWGVHCTSVKCCLQVLEDPLEGSTEYDKGLHTYDPAQEVF